MAEISLNRLRNIDLTDRELLHAIAAVTAKDGTAIAQDVAERLGIRTNGKRTPAGTVSARMSWMTTHKPDCPPGCRRHYELIERIDARAYGGKATDPPRWVITEKGRALMNGRLNKTIDNAIAKLDAGAQLTMINRLTRRAYVDSESWMAIAFRREYQHVSAQRPR